MQCACALLSSVAYLPLQYFSTLSHKSHVFRKISLEHKTYFLIFCTTFVWNISHSKKNWARYDQKCILFFMESTLYSCQILKKPELFQHVCEKHSNVKFHENRSCESCVVPWGRTYRRIHRAGEPNSLLLNFANTPKKRSMHETSAFPIRIRKWRWLFLIKKYDKIFETKL
jgi:hypothetical protein